MKDDTNKQRDFVFLVGVRSYCSVNYIGEYEKQLLIKLNVLLITLVETNSLIFGNFIKVYRTNKDICHSYDGLWKVQAEYTVKEKY